MYRIGICDDNVAVCAKIEKYLLEYAEAKQIEIDTEVFINGNELLKALASGENLFHLIFLDIELGDTDGIAVGNVLREKMQNEITKIVFISYQKEYAIQLFKIRPLDFLVKPIGCQKIYETMETYRKLFAGEKLFFEYRKGKVTYQVIQDQIICVQCEGKKIRLITPDKEIEFYGKMSDASQQLNPVKFWTTHKSYIINTDYVFEYGREEIRLTNGECCPISRAYKKEIMDKLLDRKTMEQVR